ncbi:MAG: transcriptional regulator [bacterium]|nr:transcriptional regulator [bacterium]
MDRATLLNKLRGVEWEDFEVKAATSGLPDDAYKTVSAFANTSGGWLVFGVAEARRTFSIMGVADPDALQNEFLTTCRSLNKMSRVVEVLAKLYEVEGKWLLAFYVPPASRFDKPVRVKVKKLWEAYIRVGSGDHRCSREEEDRFLRDASHDTFDSSGMPDATAGDLDSRAIRWLRGIIAEQSPRRSHSEISEIEYLEEIGLVHGEGEITRAAALLFGKDRLISRLKPAGIVDLRVIYAPWSDEQPEHRWDDRELCEGNLVETMRILFERLYHFCEKPFAMQPNGMQRNDVPPDFGALREALVNLLIHQDYSDKHRTASVLWYGDRVIFDNPGDSFVSISDMVGGGTSQLRNPKLTQILRQAGFADQAGTGIPGIVRTWRRAERLPPEIVNDPGRKTYALTLHWRPLTTPRDASWLGQIEPPVSPDAARVLTLARQRVPIDRTAARLATGLSARKLTQLLAELVTHHHLVPVGENGESYLLAEELRDLWARTATG